MNPHSSIIKLYNIMLRRFKRFIKHLVKPYAKTALRGLTTELSQMRQNAQLYKANKQSPLIEIDLVIVSYNNFELAYNFFENLKNQTYPLSKINIFIVDDLFTNGADAHFNECLKQYKHHFNSTNIVIRRNSNNESGRDLAIRNGKAKYFFNLNIDIKLANNALETIINVAENDDENVALWELRQKPFEYLKYYDVVTLETPWSSCKATLIRRQSYEQTQSFEKEELIDENLRLSYKLRSYGYILKYCPSAVFWNNSFNDNKTNNNNNNNLLNDKKGVLANSLIRLRYGSFKNIIAIPFIYLSLFLGLLRFEDTKKSLLQNLKITIENAIYFLKNRKIVRRLDFPFRSVDFTISRGESIEIKEITELPLVSIIMRTTASRQFNQLKTSILTVANQTYKNIELIIIEDGGKFHQANCEKLCIDLKLKFSYFGLPKVGRSQAGNYGLKVSTGEYLMFLDDDDYLFADHVETIISYIANDDNYVAGYSLAWEAIVDKNLTIFDCKNLEVSENTFQAYNFETLENHNFIPIQSIIFKKVLFIERGGFDESLDHLEDWNLWYRYGYKNKFKFIPKVTSIYTITESFREFIGRNLRMRSSYTNAKMKAQNSIKALDKKSLN